jgi:hypothetical protein
MLDETRAKALQEIYLVSKHPIILGCLRSEIESMSQPLFILQLKKTGFHMPKDTIEELAYDASTRFIEMYMKDSNWECRSFRNRIYLEVLFFLYSKKKKNEKCQDELDVNMASPEKEHDEDTRFVIEDLMSDTVYWRNVLIDCYKAKSYKAFIITINAYLDKKFIYDHAVRLHKLYIHTRRN